MPKFSNHFPLKLPVDAYPPVFGDEEPKQFGMLARNFENDSLVGVVPPWVR